MSFSNLITSFFSYPDFGQGLMLRLKFLRLFTIGTLALGWFFWPIWILSAYLVLYGIICYLADVTMIAIASSTSNLNGMYGVRPTLSLSQSSYREWLIWIGNVLTIIKMNFFPSYDSWWLPSFMEGEFIPPAPVLSKCNTTYLGNGMVHSSSMGEVSVHNYENKRSVSPFSITFGVICIISLIFALFF